MFSLIGRAAFGKRFHVIELDKPSRRTAPAVCGDEGALPALPNVRRPVAVRLHLALIIGQISRPATVGNRPSEDGSASRRGNITVRTQYVFFERGVSSTGCSTLVQASDMTNREHLAKSLQTDCAPRNIRGATSPRAN